MRRLPKRIGTKGIEREYARAIIGLVPNVIKSVCTKNLPRIIAIISRAHDARMRIDAPHTDAGEADDAQALLDELNAAIDDAISVDRIKSEVRRLGVRTANQSRDELNRRARSVLGRDVFAAEPGLRSQMDNFVAGNVAKIKGLDEETRTRIERRVMDAVTQGRLARDFASDLKKDFGFSDNRAALIARDQIGKFYGQQNNLRARALGLKRYRWATSNDDRVRDDHRALEGKIFEYDGPGAPGIGHPGEDYNCRCGDDPIFEDLLD